jgi:hypothetical protein
LRRKRWKSNYSDAMSPCEHGPPLGHEYFIGLAGRVGHRALRPFRGREAG